MMGKSSGVQIQIQPNLQIQIQIHSFKKVRIQPKSNLLKNLQIQIRGFKSKSTNPDLKIRWASANVIGSKSTPPEKPQIQIHPSEKVQIQSKSTGFDKSG